MKIAYITYNKQEKYSTGTSHDEDQVLLDHLKKQGLDITPAVWNDPAIDWHSYGSAVLKSPWDYHEVFPEFSAWLNKMEAIGIQLQNPYDIIRWNSDKHYLADISNAGLPVIPFLIAEQGTKPNLAEYFEKLGTAKLIIKPCISASAKNTLPVTHENVEERERELHNLLREDSYLIQPFMEEILEGELSLIFLGGRYSHSVLKMPKPGDFRVQHFHGGTIKSYLPEPELIEAAQRYVDRFAKGCLYARVDGLLVNGTFQLMELELIEPYLFLGSIPEGCERYYTALCN